MDECKKAEITEECRSFIRDTCNQSIRELQDKVTEMMNIYKSNPTFPFDFYNMALRENDTKIMAIRELYVKMTGLELE